MDRRTFLTAAGAAVVAPALPSQSEQSFVFDFAVDPDKAVARLLVVQRGAIRELHRVIGIPRYQIGSDGISRDTWQEQVDAGLSSLLRVESVPPHYYATRVHLGTLARGGLSGDGAGERPVPATEG